MSSSPNSEVERLAGDLVAGLRLELCLTPKPGLVDLLDSGSHRDLSLPVMERSIGLVGDYLGEVAASLRRGESLARQVDLGRQAEQRMLERFGTNTHKGAVFLGGLLLVARDRAGAADPGGVRQALRLVANELFLSPPRGTHGGEARRQFRVGGIVRETTAGMPSIFEAAVPAYRAQLTLQGFAAASFAMMAALMRVVEDTTALHRCGRGGLARIRCDGRRLGRLVARGGDPVPFLAERNDVYRRMNLTMGGVADLLGMAFGWLAHLGEIPEPPDARADRLRPR